MVVRGEASPLSPALRTGWVPVAPQLDCWLNGPGGFVDITNPPLGESN